MNKIRNIGHRGAKGYVPENTIPSFIKAIELNANGIELDVHVCKSGELVVIHDETVDRTTNGTGSVASYSLSELKELRINQNLQIPTLEEVLAVCVNLQLINIELKGRNTAQAVCDCIENHIQLHGWNYENFIVSSFHQQELEHVAQYNNKIPLGILSDKSVEHALEWAQLYNAQAIHPHFSLLTPENVTLAHQKGYKIYTWTVNNLVDIERMKQLKVQGIITDFPDRI